MKKHLFKILSIVSIVILAFFSNNLFSQVYLLNEDFSSATGVKPPTGWNNITVTGAASDVWRYDNPGQRSVTFPVIGTFAIFDSEQYSGSGGAEKVSLETPFVDCSFSPYIILYFDHVFKSNRGGKADVEIFDGTNWVVVKSYLDSVPVAKTESIDVSNLIGNKTGAKVRFTWQGDSSQYWIIDNVKLYAPLSKDARLKALNTPSMPTLAGVNPVAITLSNEGYQPITSATIRWSANGLAQSTYNWSGNIVRDSAQANIPIGTYNFPTGALTKLKIWVDNPNGSADLNKLNDTLDVNVLTALCGTYTIGGVSPNFATFNDAVTALHTAGVSCPVVFKVRDGVYDEQVKIFAIPGASAVNTVTFESESGDSSKVELHYKLSNATNDFTLKLSGTSHVIFRRISILRTQSYTSLVSDDASRAIEISNSIFNGINIYNTRDIYLHNNILRGNTETWGMHITQSSNVRYERNTHLSRHGIRVFGGNSDSIYVKGNTFNYLPHWSGNGYGINLEGGVKTLSEVDSNIFKGFGGHAIYANTPVGGKSRIRFNYIDSMRDAGIVIDGQGAEVLNNRVLRVKFGIGIVVSGRGSLVANNYVHTIGDGVSKGIELRSNASTSKILFNSVNVTGTDIVNGRALEVQGGSNYIIKNNIFANNGGGYATYLGSDVSTFDISNNNYYSAKQRLGFYNGKIYDTLTTFATATGKDALSIDVNPYYVSDTSLVPTHALLEGAALSMAEVSTDITNVVRASTPDIGAKEFDLCANDAGVNGFWGIGSTAPVGSAGVRVELQNNGSAVLTSATIGWSVNGVAQTPFSWTGNLSSKQSVVVNLGNYTYTAGGLFKMRAWTIGANGQVDCKLQNDSCAVLELGTQLCGTYTIGGVSPNFATFNDAVTALHTAGVSCPVVFKVRDGVYDEQVKIFAIPGASAVNTVTFESESGDSSKVELHYKLSNATNDFTLKLSGTSHVIFRRISILRTQSYTSLVSDDASRAIEISNSIFNGINIYNTRDIYLHNNILRGNTETWGMHITQSSNVRYERNTHLSRHGIRVFGGNSDSIYVKGNTFNYLPHWSGNGYGINLEGGVKTLSEVDSNIFKGFGGHAIYANTPVGGKSRIRFNYIDSMRDAGIVIDGQGAEVLNNRVLRVKFGIGIVVSGRGSLVANNYVHTIGDGVSKGIELRSNASTSKILFNSVNVTGTDIVNVRALDVVGGDGYVIKNNIFANSGGGYAAYFASMPGVKDIDYNNYYSTGSSFGYLGGQLFNNLTAWGVALNSDANSKNLNPNYKADTALLPFQKQFNGAGISSGNILLDIDGELRNQQAPDIGAQEFMVDFGVTRLVSPTNDCFQKDSTPVTIYLRQFGDIPFIDLKLAYQVNNGPIFKDTIPGTITNDLEFTFKRPQNMSSNGEYLFKIWLEENGDDNLNNDTLVVLRKNKNSPRVDFSYVTQCAGIGVPFTGTAAIDTGFIARIEWDFGDSTVGVGYTPAHIYDTSGTYAVTMRAFSDQGCFSEVKKNVVLKATPIASFSVKDACFGTSVKPVNTSIAKSGGTISNYVWKWGDGKSSTGFTPTHQYSVSDTFDITLIATGSNGCVDSVINKSVTYSIENAAFRLNKPAQDFICEGSSLKLSASGASSYQWLFDKLPIDGAVDSVYQATKAGEYAVIFVNGIGCNSNPSQPLKIKFNPAPEARFNFDSYCVGSPIQFRDSSKVDSLNRISYTWNFGDGSPAQQIGNPVYPYTKEGEYKVSLIIKSTVCPNQADTIEKTIKVELPIIGKRYEPVTVLENKSKKLEARDFGVKYQWTPSLYLDNPNIAEPKYTAGKEQTYTIKITAKSGCITVDTLQVTLYDKCDIRAPEGFSPNDDGKNDKFYPFQIGIKNMQVFRVYDRFGNLVYDDKNANSSNGWDGKHKGKKLPIGTYVWVAEGIGEDDVPVKRSGNVILIK